MERRHVKWTRNGLLLAVGVTVLGTQLVAQFTGGDPNPALITAGTSIVLSPLLLAKDEKG